MSGHFLIVEARFYGDIADAQLAGAKSALRAAGVSFEHVSVPGALEIPVAIAMAEATSPMERRRSIGQVRFHEGCRRCSRSSRRRYPGSRGNRFGGRVKRTDLKYVSNLDHLPNSIKNPALRAGLNYKKC